MKRKKMVKLIFLFIAILAIIYLIYFIFSISRIMKIYSLQDKIGETLPDTFRIELPIIKYRNTHFCIKGIINDTIETVFVIDTKATSIAKIDIISNSKASYWGRFPVPVKNYYGQKVRYPLYYFNSFKIQSLSFNKPLFKGILKSNAFYSMINEGIIGEDIIKHLFWKFSLDDEKMILFSNKDTLLLQKETENFVKIENGLSQSNNRIFFPDISMHDNFMFDTGYADEIVVNKKIFTILSEKFSPKEYLSVRHSLSSKNDASYVFTGKNVEWNGISILNCTIVYSTNVDRNIIGVELMNRFNFVLAYNEKTNGRRKNNLYIELREDPQRFENIPYCSDFGFVVGRSRNDIIIYTIEKGGLAEKAGIKLRDKIVDIDHGNYDLSDLSRLTNYLSDKRDVILTIDKGGRKIDIELNLDK